MDDDLAHRIGMRDKADFKEFSPAGSGFKVQMPGTPKEQTQTAVGIPVAIFSAEDPNGAYIVSYADLPIPGNESPDQIEKRLDGSRDGQLAHMGGSKLVSESKIQLGGKYPGRDIRGPAQQAMEGPHADFHR